MLDTHSETSIRRANKDRDGRRAYAGSGCRVHGPSDVSRPIALTHLLTRMARAHVCRVPLKKVGLPEDVAMQIVCLSSPIVSGHVTGQIVMVDGGQEGRLLNKKEDLGL